MTRPLIRWDADAQEWVVFVDLVRVAAFSKLYEAERWITAGGGDLLVLDLDDVGTEADR